MHTIGPGDLVLCSGTVPRDVSFRDRLRAAADAGFSAVSLWGRDYHRARRDGHDDAEMRTMLDDHGLVVAEIDPAWWWTPGAAEVRIPAELDTLEVFRHGEDELFRIADAVGARSVNAADVLGGSWGPEEAAEAFARLCDGAAAHGLLVHLEWLAWSRIDTLAVASEVVRLADRPNGGLTIDTWHCARTGVSAHDVAALPGAAVLSIQLDDGPAAAEDDLLHATLHERRLPGEGDFDLAGYLGALVKIGAVAPVGVEVFSDALHAQGPMVAARRAAQATRATLERAGWATR
ncbi:MAG TPA: sugar phosphate isomerase/epimerase family protein [Acidimicrobiales bacterium]|nr:sugar phosphate isomerase/epimerase family protein [Acidimicrobiales bacterium]